MPRAAGKSTLLKGGLPAGDRALDQANPEYVTALDDGWYLLLGIVCDNGQGIYLVFPDTTVITQLRNLIEAQNHE